MVERVVESANDARFDEDGLRVVDSVAQSDARRREREQQERSKHRAHQDALRAKFAAGELTMAEYAKQAREAGISASEVGATLQERAAAERRLEQCASSAQSKATEAGQPSELSAALGAKAQGLERLRKGEFADAAEAFADAAALAERAEAAKAADSAGELPERVAADAREVRGACKLNEALCHMKLEAWAEAEAACTAALDVQARSAKARFRRATARFRLGRTAEAYEDAQAAAALTPSDKDIAKLAAEIRKALPVEEAAETAAQGGGAGGDGAGGGGDADSQLPPFVSASAFAGARTGYAFKVGPEGLGYYRDDLVGDVGSSGLAAGAAGSVADRSAPAAAASEPDVSLRTYCYLSVSIGGCGAGRLVLQLFDDLLPRTALNFRSLCCGPVATSADDAADAAAAVPPTTTTVAAGATVEARPLHYKGSCFHRIAKGFMIQGGDVYAGDGSGKSVSTLDDGAPFADESFVVPHARPGILS